MEPTPISRRLFLGAAAGTAAASTAAAILPAGPAGASTAPAVHLRDQPIDVELPLGTLFTLGVASGEPAAGSVVIWTRLAPDPLAPGGGMAGHRRVPVRWEVATDPDFHRVVRHGRAGATERNGWTVHARVFGLRAGREYWYRFRAGNEIGPVGRTKTLPAPWAHNGDLRFAHASCSDYQHGEFGAYAGIAGDDLDFWIHVGDYIYEYGPNPDAYRQHDGEPTDSIESLEQYRNRYALYRLDPALQAAHAAAPMFWVPDDHEVENNHAGLIDEEEEGPTERFRLQKAAAFQAAWEHMPMPVFRRPRDERFRLYRDLRVGRLASIQLLDTRQFRTDQEGGDGIQPRPFGLDPDGSLLGDRQERWVKNRLVSHRAGGATAWQVLAQQVVMTETKFLVPGEDGVVQLFNMDAWDGYVAARQRLLDFAAEREVPGLVVLTGDIHSTWVADLCTDFARPDETVVGSELVATGITSNFPGEFVPLIEGSLPANPNVKYFNAGKTVRESTADEHHGYLLHHVTADEWRTEVRQVANIIDPAAPMSTIASFVIENGKPGPQAA